MIDLTQCHWIAAHEDTNGEECDEADRCDEYHEEYCTFHGETEEDHE